VKGRRSTASCHDAPTPPAADPTHAVVAVAGCPNSGKTTLFNHLAGERRLVGNWPGHTVERFEGRFEVEGTAFTAVDLPGTYGLVAVSADEEIAVRFLLDERPAVVVTVVDASNLEGSLHLAAQIGEAGLRQVIVLNMADVAERRGIRILLSQLAGAFAADVIPTMARRGTGLHQVRRAIAAAVGGPAPPPLAIDYGPILERQIDTLERAIAAHPGPASLAPPRWMALQLLAGDDGLARRMAGTSGGSRLMSAVAASRTAAAADGTGPELAIAERRFAWIRSLVAVSATSAEPRSRWRDRVDRVLTHRLGGLAVFLAVMWVVLRFATDVTAPLVDWIDAVVRGPLSRWAIGLLGLAGLDGGWVESLVVDGILAGVGGVLVFVPVLGGLYIMLGMLEDSGYLARAAAVMDRLMRAVGLPGRAFVPMVIGFGCNVPAVYATRTLDTPRDRLLTGLTIPFMSCGARLPVYVLLAGVFFAGQAALVVFSLYGLGVGVAILVALVAGRTALRETERVPFVMVLPDFRIPSSRVVWESTSQRTWSFVRRAGTVILGVSVGVWLLLAIPVGGGRFADTDVPDSAFGKVSRVVSPALRPLGLGEWEQAGALLSGLLAKEVVVATTAQLYGAEGGAVDTTKGATSDFDTIGVGFIRAMAATVRAAPSAFIIGVPDFDDDNPTALDTAIRQSFEDGSGGHGALASLAFMVFVLLYTPCAATAAAIRHEFGTRIMWLSVGGQLVIAWVGALATYQGGRLIGLG